jgi:DNA repair protein RecO (recombination protein O)
LTHRDSAILVGRRPAGADGKVLTFLLRKGGKVRLYYRRFPRRVKVEFLDPLQGGELLYTPPGENVPGKLHAFHCQEVWPRVRSDFDRLVCALHFADAASQMTQEGEPVPQVFELLWAVLSHLGNGADPGTLRIIYDLKLLQAAGFAPSLERCTSCQAELSPLKVSFSARGGGVFCRGCRAGQEGRIRNVGPGAISLMRKALSLPLHMAGRLRAGEKLERAILPILEEMFEEVLEKQSPSVLFLRKLSESRRR